MISMLSVATVLLFLLMVLALLADSGRLQFGSVRPPAAYSSDQCGLRPLTVRISAASGRLQWSP